ncbi:MAG: PqqD family protein [Dehalococcoidia bacterium]
MDKATRVSQDRLAQDQDTGLDDLRKLTVRPSEYAIFQEVGEDTVLLHTQTGEYYGLNEVGARIWSLLNDGSALDDVVSRVLEDHDVSEDALAADVSAFLAELEQRDLVTVHHSG